MKNPLGFPKLDLPELPKVDAEVNNPIADIQRPAASRELDVLLSRVVEVETQCTGDSTEQDQISQIKDLFLRQKAVLYTNLSHTRDLVKERNDAQQKSGNSVEVIRKKNEIAQKFLEFDIEFKKLIDIYKKQSKQKINKIEKEELDARFQDIEILSRQKIELETLFRNSEYASGAGFMSLTDYRAKADAEGGVARYDAENPPAKWEETEEDKALIERWKKRDAEFDKQLRNIGEGVDRLGEIANEIGVKADRQKELVTSLHCQADEASEELKDINNRIKKIVGDKQGCNFCCKIILAVVLVGLIAFVIAQTIDRIQNG